MDNTHRLAVELAQARESEPALRRERDEARQVARAAVDAWHGYQGSGLAPGCGYDEAEIRELRRRFPWLESGDADPWTDTKEQRLVLLEATVKVLHKDLTRLMAALEELG